jgi:hypothetical protein
MTPKPGRNDPCPCGSGKKYKKCCGLDSTPVSRPFMPEDRLSGTPLDEYSRLLPLLALYEGKIVQFETDEPELKKARKAYEKRYRPGDDGGLLDSHFMSWLYFDLRFGPSRKTLIERVLDDPMTAKLVEPGPTCLRDMTASYATFYEVINEGPPVVLLEELGTGRLWTVYFYRELFDTPPGKGEIWYTRLIGSADKALCYTTPYVYEPESRAQFKRGVEGMAKDFLKNQLSIGVPADRLFAESQKQSALFWAEYIHTANNAPADMLSSVPGEWTRRFPFQVVNTDRQELVFSEMHFKVRDETAMRRRLAKLKTFLHNETDDSWSWLKAPSRKFPEDPRTSLGRFRFKDGMLIAETNSRERAAHLECKLVGHFPGMLKLEKTLYRDLDDIPPLSPGEIEKSRREDDELNAQPEVQEALKRYQEHYYFEKWPRAKVPALGNITPIQAAKTEAGRRKLEDLLEYYERLQDAQEPAKHRPKLDLNKLRSLLGLPPKHDPAR